MVSVTLSIPQALREKMKEHEEIRWSDVIRAIIERKLEELDELDNIASKSKLTQEDIDEIAGKIGQGMARHAREIENALSSRR